MDQLARCSQKRSNNNLSKNGPPSHIGRNVRASTQGNALRRITDEQELSGHKGRARQIRERVLGTQAQEREKRKEEREEDKRKEGTGAMDKERAWSPMPVAWSGVDDCMV